MVEAVPADQEKGFAPKQTLLKNLESEMSGGDKTKNQLEAENAVTPLDQYFTCTICTYVVEEPKECQECNQLCCDTCISQWVQRQQTCPNCRAKLNLGKNVNRFVKQSLDNTLFECDKCPEQFKYEARKQHQQACDVVLKCNVEYCANGAQIFDSREALRSHWMNECSAIQLQCSRCKGFVTRPQVAAHSCENGLLGVIKRLEQRVMELEAENAALKTRPDQPINQNPVASHAPQTNKVCHVNHPMVFKTQPFTRLSNGMNHPGVDLFCNGCRGHVVPSIGYFRCNSAQCDYDLCVRCGMTSAPVNRPAPAQQFFNQPQALKCFQGHPIVFFPTGQAKQRQSRAGVHIYQGNCLFCNGCRNQFQIAARGGSYSCQQLCDYDLCVNCVRCANGHQLMTQHGNPYSLSHGALSSAYCDRCRFEMNTMEMSAGFLRCPTCEYDVCRRCIPEPRQ